MDNGVFGTEWLLQKTSGGGPDVSGPHPALQQTFHSLV